MERLWDWARYWARWFALWPSGWRSWVKARLGLIKEHHAVYVLPAWVGPDGVAWLHPRANGQTDLELLYEVDCGWCGQIGWFPDPDDAFRAAFEHSPDVRRHIYDRWRAHWEKRGSFAKPS
jgi:hypothetical protein